ncbi:MAG: hypothetical protein HY519_02780 [Candidatus Aenigmarchaeota archaeon]|nr:hypothetical protein [Candidatus Aenigmarchaeota archaeon]
MRTILVLLGILVAIGIVQAVQIASLSGQMTGKAPVAVTPAQTQQASGGQNVQLPNSLQNLPAQVGGC